jgi:hypothetical protein
MVRRVFLHVVAWLAIPIAFATFVNFAYRNALRHGKLPFDAQHLLSWWVGFSLALLLGSACMFVAHRQARLAKFVWPIAYIVVMGVGLAGIHLSVACKWGDCL